jgi:putative ABC transport system ATP-binding protein
MSKDQFNRETVLQTVGLTREYRVGHDTVTALGGVDISIQKGEFVAIMGPSGCGKSTLLNLIGGLDQPTAGQVLLEGQDLSGFSEEELAALRRQKMGFIFQRHDLFPILTARENIEFPMLLAGMPHDERREKSDGLLNLVDLADKADHLPDELSGGQQQRIGIARALANASSILLADEPTGNLDSRTGQGILELMTRLNRERGLTVVLVSHDEQAVSAHAGAWVRLHDGRIVETGS